MTPDSSLAGQRVGIVGAGLVGSLLAIHLGRRGATVDVFEKRPDLRRHDIPGGRTIVMSLSDRGWHALAEVDLDEALRPATLPKESRAVHDGSGTLHVQPYGADGQAIWTVDRKQLNCLLMDAAPDTVAFHHEHELRDLEPDTPALTVENRLDGGRRREVYDHVIGTDGLFSTTRELMTAHDLVREEFLTLDYGYRELTIPADPHGRWVLSERSVHIWPADDALFIALPSHAGTFTCSLFYHKRGGHPLAAVGGGPGVVAALRERFAGAAALIPDLAENLAAGKPSDICAVKCDVWNHRDRVLLLGDAAHAIVPFFAMGMNVGFEDCSWFARRLDENGGDLGEVIRSYGAWRKPHTDAIFDLSLRNFQSIGHSDRDGYHARWLLERRLWSRYPTRWRPLYAMIAFSRLPLAEVQARAAVQTDLLDTLLAAFGPDAASDHPAVDRWLAPRLAERLPDLPA